MYNVAHHEPKCGMKARIAGHDDPRNLEVARNVAGMHWTGATKS